MTKKNSDAKTIFWWIAWITLTIVSFFISCAFWTPMIGRHFGNMNQPGAPLVWVAAVFGSWMVLLVPLIVVMYNKVDKAYEDARIARETTAFEKKKTLFQAKSIYLEESQRMLNKNISKKIKTFPEAIEKGHLVEVCLRDGRRIPNVFIANGNEVLGIYGFEELPFATKDVVDVEAADLNKLPAFETTQWLRLDGVGEAGL